jgi:hypothetical protein
VAARYYMRVDPWWRPLLLVGGVTRENSYVEFDDHDVTFCFGILFGQTVPRSQIASIKRRDWPIWIGVGWRTDFINSVGLIGSYSNVVEIELKEPITFWRFARCTRLAASLEQPDEFIAALSVTRAGVS